MCIQFSNSLTECFELLCAIMYNIRKNVFYNLNEHDVSKYTGEAFEPNCFYCHKKNTISVNSINMIKIRVI